LDAYFTPPDVASVMVDAIEICDVAIVVDPTAGDGALLRSASRRWPNASLIGTDIDEARVSKLEPEWDVAIGDFLDPTTASRLAERAARSTTASVLLNPPFSSRGATTYCAGVGAGAAIVGSRAMAFFLGASALVGVDGQLVALLPAGVLTSQRDFTGRQWLHEHGSLEKVARVSKRAFRGAVAETVVMRWTPRPGGHQLRAPENNDVVGEAAGWNVVRGARQMHTVQPGSGPDTVPLVHTTDLKQGGIAQGTNIRPSDGDRVICGPAILVPRVGRPDVRKLVLYLGGPIALSDCVFGICHPDEGSCALLHETLIADFDGLKERYGGTGAPYLRRADLVALIAELTQCPQPVEPSPPRLGPEGSYSSQSAVATLTKTP
jgi:hypothetical protein